MKLGTKGFVGDRLKEGRQARGLTAISLASVLGVTRAAISQYEKGDQTPRPDVMERICQCLGLPLNFFMRERPAREGAIFWRSQASTTALARKAAKWRLNWFQDITDYLREDFDFPAVNLPDLGVPLDPLKLKDSDIEQIAMTVRRHWGLGDEPISSVMTLLENNGVFISRDDLYVSSLDGLSQWPQSDGPFCLVASGKCAAVRTTMNLLHELGHLILHRDLDQRYVSMPLIHKVIEEQAFAFAGAFALPEESFASDLYSLSIDSFINLKARWRIAISAMIKRCEALGICSESQSEKLWRTLSARGWRTEEPLDEKLPIEHPRLISRAVEILLADGRPREVIVNDLALPDVDIEDIACMPRGTLSEPDGRVQTMPIMNRDKQREPHGGQPRVLKFKKRV